MRHRYSLLLPTEGSGYAALIQGLVGICTYCSLTVRDHDRRNDGILTVLGRLVQHQERVERVSEWPGTRLTRGAVADLHWYRLSPALGDMLKAQPGLYAWMSPHAPEDLCFYRADRSCVLASISHEADAWFDVDDDEVRRLSRAVPQLQLTRE